MRNIVAIVLMVATVTTTAQAAEVDALRERVADCESALDRADRAIDIQADTIQQLDAQNARIQKALDYSMAQEAEARAWYRQPELVGPLAFVLGVVAGAYAVRGR